MRDKYYQLPRKLENTYQTHWERRVFFFLLKASINLWQKNCNMYIYLYSYSFICLTFIFLSFSFLIFHNRIIDDLTLHVKYVHDILYTVKLTRFFNNVEKYMITEKTGFPIKFLFTKKWSFKKFKLHMIKTCRRARCLNI